MNWRFYTHKKNLKPHCTREIEYFYIQDFCKQLIELFIHKHKKKINYIRFNIFIYVTNNMFFTIRYFLAFYSIHFTFHFFPNFFFVFFVGFFFKLTPTANEAWFFYYFSRWTFVHPICSHWMLIHAVQIVFLRDLNIHRRGGKTIILAFLFNCQSIPPCSIYPATKCNVHYKKAHTPF